MDGEWEADTMIAINLRHGPSVRSAARGSSYGDLSPWGTMISSEENYAHPRVSLTATTSDIMDAGSGVGTVVRRSSGTVRTPPKSAPRRVLRRRSWRIQGSSRWTASNPRVLSRSEQSYQNLY
ncbi:hypothetical protein C8039_03950 [Halogeometricum sp. wsp3]|nr:hypothetical protein C8039_03950 [Halogeometricum sp. wsp3]